MSNYEFTLGSVIRDKVTGFQGVASSRTEWLDGCIRYGITSQNLHDGKPISEQWFDIQRIEAVQEQSPMAEDEGPKEVTGGPHENPTR